MSLPKSWFEFGTVGVARKLVEQQGGVEDVDAHAGERHGGLVRHARWLGRLLEEGDNPVLGVDMHDAKAGRLHPRHLDAADGHVRAGVDVLLQHQLVVHLVNVVAGQNDHVLGIVALNDVDVLGHRVGGAEIPLALRHPLRGRQNVEALVALRAKEVPAAL